MTLKSFVTMLFLVLVSLAMACTGVDDPSTRGSKSDTGVDVGDLIDAGDHSDVGGHVDVGDRPDVGIETDTDIETDTGNETDTGDETDTGNETDTGDETDTGIEPGSLRVTVAGLPPGASASIAVVDVNDHSVPLPSSGLLEGLEPGDYDLIPADVVVGDAQYTAPTASVTIASNSESLVTITYAAAANVGTFNVHVSAPDSTSLDFEIVSAGNVAEAFSTTGDAARTFSLAPGTYTLELTSATQDEWGNPITVAGLGAAFTLNAGTTVDRHVSVALSTMVTTSTNSGAGSLRSVVANVNPGSTISFAPHISEVTLASSRIMIDKDLTIMGHGEPEDLVIRGAGSHGLFDAAHGTRVTFQSLTLRNGRANLGGAIDSEAILTLHRVDLRSNIADTGGGAISQQNGRLILRYVRAFNNSSGGDGGVILSRFARVTVEDSHFEGNTATEYGGVFDGMAFVEPGLRIKRNLFKGNTAKRGAAIYAATPGVVENNTFFDNTASQRGAGLYQAEGGDLRLVHNTFTQNTSPQGSAIWKHQWSQMSLGRNLITGNSGHNTTVYVPIGTGHLFESSGYNIIAIAFPDGINQDPSDILRTGSYDARLLDLQDNGGFTHTIGVAPDSDAYLAVPDGVCVDGAGAPLVYDQRMALRPVNGYCTIGAWETGEVISGTFEDFENTGLVGTGYVDGSFVGREGFVFTFTESRNQADFPITGAGLMFRDNTSTLTATIPGGVDEISLDYRKAFTSGTNRQIEIWVNGSLVATSPVFGSPGQVVDETIYNLSVSGLNIAGSFSLEIRNRGAQVVIDNLIWH